MKFFLINLNHDSNFESSYIKNKLLKKVDFLEINLEEIKNHQINDNLIVIYSGGDNEQQTKVKEIIKSYDLYLLIHLSDETLQHDLILYPKAKKIIRNYYNPRLQGNNIMTVPIGYKNQLERDEVKSKDINSRIYKWSFAGTMKNDRGRMVKKLKKLEPNFVHITESFFSEDHLKPTKYKNIISDSIFVLCPRGYSNFESFRIMESLENYSIPIFKRELFFDHLKPLYGDHIFITSYTWRGVSKKIRYFYKDKLALEKYFKDLMDWYEEYNETLSVKINEFLRNDNSTLNRNKNINFEIFNFECSKLSFKIEIMFLNYISKIKKILKALYVKL